MKTKIFFLAMLAGITASANVYITPLSTDYINKTVTFRVEWTGDVANDRVWVFVDLCPVSGTSSGTFEKAVISGATATAGSILTVTGNMRGFYVTTNPSTVTAKLNNAAGQFNWCAYGSDYPPNAISYNNGSYTLKGTKPFIVNGTTVNNDKYAVTTITSLTDATGCPGGVGRDEVHNGGICVEGLIAFSTHCRDAIADEASTYVGLGIEIKNAVMPSHANCDGTTGCPSGWRYPTLTEVQIMNTERTAIWGVEGPTGAWINDGCASNNHVCNDCSGTTMKLWYFGELLATSCGVYRGQWRWWKINNCGRNYYQPLLCVR
ncbi:MAG: hypothetical protein LBU42_03020 [Prevotellaceae bacterium]|nr:hypothetical protein [Prevotellaceae bacterium]